MAESVKPRIRLRVWFDCGHKYSHWVCFAFRAQRKGYGNSPLAAYDDWLLRNLAA